MVLSIMFVVIFLYLTLSTNLAGDGISFPQRQTTVCWHLVETLSYSIPSRQKPGNKEKGSCFQIHRLIHCWIWARIIKGANWTQVQLFQNPYI